MRLQDEREARRWSKSELARRAGLNHTTVGQIESGRFKPYPGQLRKLAFALGLPEEEAHSLLDDSTNTDEHSSAQLTLPYEEWHQAGDQK